MSGEPDRYASPPCLAQDVAPDYFDPLAVDPAQARDVARWRKAERARLRAERDRLGVDALARIGAALRRHLRALLDTRFDGSLGWRISGYWPIRGEPDLRPLLAELHEEGAKIALPVVAVKAAPLVFRRWTPATQLVRGEWDIPVPPPEAAAIIPQITLAPLVGWDDAGCRLGYGGGYFDRTLAMLDPRPVTIGIGFQAARLATIYPQPHDVPLDFILTEAGLQMARIAP